MSRPKSLSMVRFFVMVFIYELTVRFYEVDRVGIIFFGRFYEYCYVVLEEFFTVMFGYSGAIFEEYGFGMLLVYSEVDYIVLIRMGDQFIVYMEVEDLGCRFIIFAYMIIGINDGVECCRVKFVHVFVDMQGF